MSRKLQVAVVGSAGPDHAPNAEALAEQVGKLIATDGHTLVFGPELKPPSLSTLAAESALKNGGATLAIALGRGKTAFYGMEFATAWVFPDAAGGGTREMVIANSCDGLIALGGGVGTLLEIAAAYTNKVPIVLMAGTGGWADKIVESYLDAREKVLIFKAKTAAEALRHIETEAEKRSPRTLSNI